MVSLTQDHLNCQVVVRIEDGRYKGTVKSVINEPRGIVLANVRTADDKEAIAARLTFYEYELDEITVLKNAPTKKKAAVQHKKQPPRRPISSFHHMEKEFVVNDDSESDEISHEDATERTISILDQTDLKDLPNYVVLNAIDENFQSAIKCIREEGIAGVSIGGTDISRNGVISIITVSTRNCVYLFDVHVLKEKAFRHGLKQVFESPSIVKVFHDCRMPSDGLFHLYNVKLSNVFDTQVADVLLFKRENNNRLPSCIRSLEKCLMDHLELKHSEVYAKECIRNEMNDDPIMWTCRPLPKLLIDALTKSAKHLLELRRIMMEKMLQEFTSMVNLYLNVSRDADRREVEMNKDLMEVPAFFFGQQASGLRIPVFNRKFADDAFLSEPKKDLGNPPPLPICLLPQESEHSDYLSQSESENLSLSDVSKKSDSPESATKIAWPKFQSVPCSLPLLPAGITLLSKKASKPYTKVHEKSQQKRKNWQSNSIIDASQDYCSTNDTSQVNCNSLWFLKPTAVCSGDQNCHLNSHCVQNMDTVEGNCASSVAVYTDTLPAEASQDARGSESSVASSRDNTPENASPLSEMLPNLSVPMQQLLLTLQSRN